jgi:polyisoprenoid-binding protein YceI
LRHEDFFEVEKYPTATVRVHAARRDGENELGEPRYRAKFEIQIRDVTKTVEGEFEITSGPPRHVQGRLNINRVEFGVGKRHSGWNPMSIRERIPIEFETDLSGP